MMDEEVNDLWEDMARLNMLYEELCWDHRDVLEFVPDYTEDVIIIRNKTRRESGLDEQGKPVYYKYINDARMFTFLNPLDHTP